MVSQMISNNAQIVKLTNQLGIIYSLSILNGTYQNMEIHSTNARELVSTRNESYEIHLILFVGMISKLHWMSMFALLHILQLKITSWI